jgi:hypothetical protein
VGVYGGRDDCGYGHCVVVKTNAQMMDGAYEQRVFSFIVRLINADDGIITLRRSL